MASHKDLYGVATELVLHKLKRFDTHDTKNLTELYFHIAIQ